MTEQEVEEIQKTIAHAKRLLSEIRDLNNGLEESKAVAGIAFIFKPKFEIRYMPGAGDNFGCCCISSLLVDDQRSFLCAFQRIVQELRDEKQKQLAALKVYPEVKR